MTVAPFDAPASTTPRRSAAASYPRTVAADARRNVRVVWLTVLFVRREAVTIERFRSRFGVSERTFWRDLVCLRDAGMYIDTESPDNYRMTCFMADSDGS